MVMDLLSFFSRSPERQIERARKKVKQPLGDPAVRINAVRRLLEMNTPESLLAVLDRFTISADPSRQDEVEKDQLFEWLVEEGEKMVPVAVRFLKQNRHVYWPARLLKEILSEGEFAATAQEILEYHWENPPAMSEPKAQLIRAVAGVESPQLRETVKRFLEDEDDDTVIAAVDYLMEGEEDEEAREAILKCYVENEDRPRLRAHILEEFAESRWNVRGYRPTIEETLPEGYTLTREGTLKAIGRG